MTPRITGTGRLVTDKPELQELPRDHSIAGMLARARLREANKRRIALMRANEHRMALK